MATATIRYPRCNSGKVYRYGHSYSQHERFRCRPCKRAFQLIYSYEARRPSFKGLIVEMTHNGTGVVVSPEH